MKKIDVIVSVSSFIRRTVEVSDEELNDIRNNDSELLNELWCEIDYANDANHEYDYEVYDEDGDPIV